MKFNSLNSLYLESVFEQDVFKLISSLKSLTAGYDNIGATMLKLCSSSITPPLTHICNLALQEGVFPDKMNIANVIILFKSEDPQMFNNYRPVSVLCAPSKVFENIMYHRLLNYLNEQNHLFSHQFGFRKHHSTYMALMTLVDKVTKYLDDGEYVVGIFLDLSKAFDTFNHLILLKKTVDLWYTWSSSLLVSELLRQ